MNTLFAFVLLISQSVEVPAQPGDWTLPPLRFVEGAPDRIDPRQPLPYMIPAAAQFEVEVSLHGGVSPDLQSSELLSMPDAPPAAALSDAQIKMMQTERWAGGYFRSNDQYTLRLFAVSEQDAGTLARAALEAINRRHRKACDEARALVDDLDADLAKIADQAARTEGEVKTLNAQREKLESQLGYHDDGPAEREQFELERMSHVTEIEITGIRAKVDAIQKARQDGRASDQGARSLLDRLQLEQDIELAGALARSQAMQDRLTYVRDYRRTVRDLKKAYAEQAGIQFRVQGRRSQAQQAAERLRSLPPELRPVEMLDGIVTVRPIVRQ